MKVNNIFSFIFHLLLSGISICTFAQQPKPCGNYSIDPAALRKALGFEKAGRDKILATNILVRVYFHILSNDDGTLAGATLAQVTTEFNTLLADYAPDNICFLNAGLNTINSTKLNTNFNIQNDSANMFDPFRVPGCINVFYMQQISGSNTACAGNCGIGGYAIGGIPGTFCLVANSNIGSGQTISHEVAHCLGLLHTFETKNGFEDTDGSNASTSADLITDTPADPFAYNSQPCFATINNACIYNGSCTDPKGSKNFNPPYTNLMAYWWNGKDIVGNTVFCYPALALTPAQYTRVNSYLNTNADLVNCGSPADVIESDINISSGFLMASGINSLTTNNIVNISGTANVTFGGGRVLLEPGFHAVPAGNGLFLARTKPCN